ncbi:MAG TPA: MarR family transcriptional regulator [Acidothermaceae bacterium]
MPATDGPVVDRNPLVDHWRTLLEQHARVTCALEKALGEHGLGVSEFEVLDELASQPQSECRMQALSDVVHLSQSALSRVVGRLEEEGLVTRVMCQQDRRGIFAHLTDEGRTRYEAALPTHREVLAENLQA